MELRQLKCFVAVAEGGGFSEASRNLFLSQSAVSQQIRLLEDELNAKLFVRKPHGVCLTELGEHLLPMARQVLRSVEMCHECINDFHGLLKGEINVGMTYTLEPYVREAMLQFMRQYPHVQINAHYKNLPELLKKLHCNDIDMMLAMMPTSSHDFIVSVPLLRYRLAAIMRRSHVLAGKKSLSFVDLQQHLLILPEKGIRDRNAIESYIHAETGQLNIRSLVNDANAILNILEQSNYVSILAENTIADRPELCAVPIQQLSEPILVYAHFNKDVPRKPSANAFLECLKSTSAYFNAGREKEI